MAQQQDLFDAVDDEKAERFENDLQKLEQKVEDAGPEDYSLVAQQIENTMDSVDNILTTLQEEEDIGEEEVESIKDDVKDLDNIEKQSAGSYHLSVKELKDQYRKLHEQTDARIKEWLSYMLELAELKVELYESVADQLNEKRATTEAVDKIESFMESREKRIQDMVNDQISKVETTVTTQIESQVTAETAELREKVVRTEQRLEYMEQNFQQAMDVIDQLLPLLQTQAATGSTRAQAAMQEAEDLKQDVEQDLTGKAESVSNTYNDGSEDGSTSGDNEDGENLFDDVGPDGSEPQQDTGDAEPAYEFYNKSLGELKAEFQKVAENENVDEVTFKGLDAKSDVSYESIRKKYHQVRDEYGDEIPELGGR